MAEVAADAERELSSEQEISGEFSLGVSTTIAQYVLPRLLGAFLDEHPPSAIFTSKWKYS